MRLPIRRPHPDVVVVLLAILGVAGLTLASRLTAPAPSALADALAEEGARVIVEARVLMATHTLHGRAIVLAWNGTRTTALAAPGVGPERGDIVRVTGVVSRLTEGIGISAQGVDVLVPAATRPLDPSEVARTPADFDGARVLIRGVLDSNGLLAGGGARLHLAGTPAPGEKGGAWLVAGTFRYHTTHAEFVLEADSWTRPLS